MELLSFLMLVLVTYQAIAFDSSANKVVIVYRDGGNSNYSTLIVGTVSGTSISFGSEVVFNQGQSDYSSAVFDSTSNKVVIGYQAGNNSNYGTGIVFQNAFDNTVRGEVASGSSASVDIIGTVSTNQLGSHSGAVILCANRRYDYV